MTTALITGVAGQDGRYLAGQLLAEGLRVVGTVRDHPSPAAAVYLDGVEVVRHDVRDATGFAELLAEYRPDEIYNLAAISSLQQAWRDPSLASATNADAVAGLLQSLVQYRDGTGHEVRFLQASSAQAAEPDNPYGDAKAAAEEHVREARDGHGVHASIAVLHNHESPLRPAEFVVRKITRAAAAIAMGDTEPLRLGNLDVSRDWGFAADYVEALTLMIRAEKPAELGIGTGVTHSLRDVVEIAFTAAGVPDCWEKVVTDGALLRPTDAAVLVADVEPAAQQLRWRARTGLADLIAFMVDIDLRRLRSGIEDELSYLTARP